MSRSTILLKEIFTGIHLVAITEIKKHETGVFIRFSANGNKHFDKIYKLDSEFIAMCGDAGTITDEHVIDDVKSIGKSLWICIKEVWKDENNVSFELFQTLRYQEGTTEPPIVKEELFVEKLHVIKMPEISEDKKQIIALHKEMIKNIMEKDKDNFDVM